MKLKESKLVQSVILLFCIASSYFFKPAFVDIQILKPGYYLMLVLIIFLYFNKSVKEHISLKNMKFGKGIKFTLFATLFSVIPALLSWDQPIITTLIATLPYLGYFFYYFLITYKPDVKKLEKFIVYLGLFCVALSVVAVLIYPTILYGANKEDENITDRGFARITIGCSGFIFLAFFLCINKYKVYKKKKWLSLSFILLIGILLNLSRQVIIGSLLIAAIYGLVQIKNNFKRILLVAGLTASTFVFLNIPFVKNLIEITQDQSQNYKDNIRVLSGKYFLTNFSPDLFTTIFGNGEAALNKSSYGYKMADLKESGFYQSDVGFIGFYSKFGIIAILSWVFIFIRMTTLKLKPEYLYVKLYLFLNLITGFTSSQIFNGDYIPSICIALYIAEYACKFRYNRSFVREESDELVKPLHSYV
jgi:hypothetical protein